MLFRSPNLLDHHSPEHKPKILLRKISKYTLYTLVVFSVAALAFTYEIGISGNSWMNGILSVSEYLGSGTSFLPSSDEKFLAGEEEDRVNVLLLGYGGEGHAGTYLTDTIILASFKPSTKEAALLSFPRDLVVNIPGYQWRKINHVYAFGEYADEGNGGLFAKNVLSDILQIPIHYYVSVDFDGFKKVVDDVGGVSISVEQTLDDYQYPIPGRENAEPPESRYQHLHIDQGWNEMNGDLALKYVRSRHASGVEGSDIARTKRQQNLLMALKDKILSVRTLFNPKKITSLLQTFSSSVKTDFEFWELLKIAQTLKNFDDLKVTSQTLEQGNEGVLVGTQYDGAFVLEPKNQDYSIIRKIAQHIFNTEIQEYAAEQNSSSLGIPKALAKEDAERGEMKTSITVKNGRIVILNGTKKTGLAATYKQRLEQEGYHIFKIGNAPSSGHSQTIIYDFSNNYPATVLTLKASFKAIVSDDVPKELLDSGADIIIVLGTDNGS